MKYRKLWIWCDGSSIGNPGRGGAGAIARDSEGRIVFQNKKYLGEDKTGNETEIEALTFALGLAANQTDEIELYTDSKLAVKGLVGEWNIKKEHLKRKLDRVELIAAQFESVNYHYISRKKNKEADALAKVAARIEEKRDMSDIISD